MIDFLKMDIKDSTFANNLAHNQLLNFSSGVNIHTGEIISPVEEAISKKLKFQVYPSDRVAILGSIHKFWNNGVHNYNDFNLKAINEVIADLNNNFGIDPTMARIHNLEVGLNIVTPFNPDLLLNNILNYKSEPFNKMKIIGQGNGKYVKFDQFEIKMYNKGLQYGLQEYILRFEIKYTRMARLGLGNVYLKHLGCLAFIRQCLEKLLSEFNELIITETIDKSILSRVDRNLYTLGNNPRSWADMPKNRRCTNRANFNNLIKEYGPWQLRENTLALLEKKGNELICPEMEPFNNSVIM